MQVLERELQLVKDAPEVVDAQAVGPEKRETPAFGLVERDHSICSAPRLYGGAA